MQFVNVTNRNIYSRSFGTMTPGMVSPSRGRDSRKLEEALEYIVSECKGCLGIRLSKKEADLLQVLLELDEKGSRFRAEDIPAEIRNDPYGAKRAIEKSRKAQQAEMDAMAEKNANTARREAEINGEVLERKPVGPATMEGEPVDPSMIKSGFERIMEENARIAAGKSEKKNSDVNEILDPIGAHAKGTDHGNSFKDDGAPKSIGKDPAAVERAMGRKDDATRTADAEVPRPTVAEKATEMDKTAAEVAEKLSTIGPVDNAPKKRGRGRKSK